MKPLFALLLLMPLRLQAEPTLETAYLELTANSGPYPKAKRIVERELLPTERERVAGLLLGALSAENRAFLDANTYVRVDVLDGRFPDGAPCRVALDLTKGMKDFEGQGRRFVATLYLDKVEKFSDGSEFRSHNFDALYDGFYVEDHRSGMEPQYQMNARSIQVQPSAFVLALAGNVGNKTFSVSFYEDGALKSYEISGTPFPREAFGPGLRNRSCVFPKNARRVPYK